jgi:PAS domain S-box-containing protein
MIGLISIILYRMASDEIEKRQRAEDEVRFNASIIQNLPDAVCGIDLNGNTVAWNAGAEKMLGYTAGEIIGKPITLIIPGEIARQELEHCLTILNAEGVLTGYESMRLHKDGRRVPVDLTAVAGNYVMVAMLLAMSETSVPPGKEPPGCTSRSR